MNGSISQNDSQVDMGIILSQLTSVNKNDVVALSVNGKSVQLTIAGVIQTGQQSDAELIMPLTALQPLTGDNGTVSFVEFSFKDADSVNTALGNITQTLPKQCQGNKSSAGC